LRHARGSWRRRTRHDAGWNAARDTVRKARDEALNALGELRDLSRGLRPALLQDRGLGTAIEDLAQRSALPVTVTLTGTIERTPETVQTAAYFVVAEALTNAAKHSQAAEVNASAWSDDDNLYLSIRDDGIGGADAGKGSGLIGLKDRVEALGGQIEMVSPPGSGTSLHITIPVNR
jgi:signal transduction histidine kinase